MKPLTLERLVGILSAFLQSPRAVRVLANGGLAAVTNIVGMAELMIHRGMSAYPNLATRTNRVTTLRAWLGSDIRHLKPGSLTKRLANIRVYLNDIMVYAKHTFRNGRFQPLDTEVGNYRIRDFDPPANEAQAVNFRPVDYHFWSNISQGLVRSYRGVKYMFANNHLLARTLTEPETFLTDLIDLIEATGTVLPTKRSLRVSLETGSDNMTKIDDASIVLENIDVTLDLNGYPFTLRDLSPRVSLDSKVYIVPDRLGADHVVTQQVFLTLQDRVERELFPIVRQVIGAGLTAENQAEVIQRMVPILFQQNVIKPADTAALSEAVLEKFEKRFIEIALQKWDVWSQAMDIARDHPGLDAAVEQALRDHARTHFLSGKFVKETTDIQFFDFGTTP